MHLRGQAEDERLEYHPQFPRRFSEESTQNSQGKMTEWNTALTFIHWKQELCYIFTYSIISTKMQNCFKKNKNQT